MTEEDGPPIALSRRDLYELVWSKPVRDLAKDFGISDVALAKRCRRLGIPIPGRGYWARVDAGQNPHRPKLPDRESVWSDNRALTVAPSDEAPPKGPPPSTEDQVWLREKLAFEEHAGSRIEVPPITRRWHPVIRDYREKLEAAAEEMRASRKASDNYEKWPEWRKRKESDNNARRWRWAKDRGQRLWDTHKPAAFRVSLDTYKRALSIVNALALAAASRGFVVGRDEKIARIVFTAQTAEIHLRMTELLQARTRPQIRYDGKTEQETYKVPTGRLRMTLATRYREGPSFEDRETAMLDSQLNQIFTAMYRLTVKLWQREREHIEDQRRRNEENARRFEAQLLRAAQEQARAEELARRKSLSAESIRWTKARRIRDYVSHIRTLATDRCLSDESLERWIVWAMRVASELDPCEARLSNPVVRK